MPSTLQRSQICLYAVRVREKCGEVGCWCGEVLSGAGLVLGNKQAEAEVEEWRRNEQSGTGGREAFM